MRAWRGWALIGTAGLALLAGCGGGLNTASNGAGANAVAPAAPKEADSAAGGGGPAVGSPNGGTGSGSDGSTGTGGGKASPRSPGAQGSPLVNTRSLIRRAELTVAVKDIPGQAQRAVDIVGEAGGEVFSEDRKLDGEVAVHRIEIVVQVPPKDLESVLTNLARLGTEQSRRSSTQDVTEQVVDIDARVGSARASLARVRALYGRATTIADITSLEAQLSQREADLESLEAQQRSLAAQTVAATITLHLVPNLAPTTQAPPPPTRNGPSGFASALKAGWHALAVSTSWLLTVLGAVLPFGLLLAALGYLAWRVDRRLRANRPAAPVPPAPAE